MTDLLQLVISGLATGGIYALAAIGFTLLWQTSQTINFAQGEFVMVPAFFALAAMKLGLPFLPALLVAVLLSMLLLGVAFRYVVVGPLLQRGVLPLVISTIALSIILKETVKDFYSAEAQVFPTLLPDRVITLLPGVAVSLAQIGVLIVSLVTIAALQWFLAGTRTGRQMQATAQNPGVARILGVPVERMILYTFVINAGLAAMASILISPIYLAKFSNGETLGLVAFVAAIVGGFNQVRGAIAGGLLLGLLDNLAAAYVSTAYRQAIPLILLVLIILFRPQGLLGRREERAV
jgi:branched-chain amino acid transport system permease protein